MSEPVVFDKKPCIIELEAGTYWWCRCGRSQNQPFCDGAHTGTDIEPLKFEVPERKRFALCLCKHTKHEPHCDGQHSCILS
ncbi:MAG: CDGSH iron-sulfur domain-containing protein [Candidatus Obscuribacterales bacterium]|nr:CDGSH iron-sulfur domain-containing protein [Candidatus Obscuribacterales bacterium]